MPLTITRVSVTSTEHDWQLYTSSVKHCDVVAAKLNQAFERAIASGKDRDETRAAMLLVMDKYAGYGASETEPHDHLERLLARVFGRSN